MPATVAIENVDRFERSVKSQKRGRFDNDGRSGLGAQGGRVGRLKREEAVDFSGQIVHRQFDTATAPGSASDKLPYIPNPCLWPERGNPGNRLCSSLRRFCRDHSACTTPNPNRRPIEDCRLSYQCDSPEGQALEDGIRSIVIRLEEAVKSGLEFGGTH